MHQHTCEGLHSKKKKKKTIKMRKMKIKIVVADVEVEFLSIHPSIDSIEEQVELQEGVRN